jgi:hypothetical protein
MSGRHIVIAGALALAIGAAPLVAAKPGNAPDRPDKPAKVRPGKARSPLMRPAEAADENAKGRIDIAQRPGGKLELRVKGQRLDAGLEVEFTIQQAGDEIVVADGVVTNDEGSVKLAIRTHKGDVLPLDAETLGDLVGATIRIRDAAALPDAVALLSGRVPEIGADLPRRLRLSSNLALADGQTEGSGRVQARFRGKDVRSELRVRVAGLSEGDLIRFLIDDGSGVFVEFATASANVDGEAEYRSRTHHGGSMPLDAATVLDLLGRAVQVEVEGALRLEGAIPSAE